MTDADSSRAAAVLAAAQGKTFVLQGASGNGEVAERSPTSSPSASPRVGVVRLGQDGGAERRVRPAAFAGPGAVLPGTALEQNQHPPRAQPDMDEAMNSGSTPPLDDWPWKRGTCNALRGN